MAKARERHTENNTMTHIDHLLTHVSDLAKRRILDIGAGRGDFLVDAVRRGFDAEGIELNPAYIAQAHGHAKEAGVSITIREGVGEALPYEDATFDFVNASELLEHVHDPDGILKEIARVLTPEGKAYISVPNRFGFYDPHFHLYFVNWLPRAWSETFIRLFGKQKNYAYNKAGYQKLTDMHYMTRVQFERLCKQCGLVYRDSRERKLMRLPAGFFLIPVYRVFSFFFIPTFHGFIQPHGK